MRVTILRGVSGSGKTTWTKQEALGAYIVSTDFYFLKEGVYHFDPTKLHKYHLQCFHDFMEAILRKEAWVVVDNTNIRIHEFAPYVIAAEAYGYTVEILTFACPPEIAIARKQLLPQRIVEQKARDLDQETRAFPRHFNEIHRIVPCDRPLQTV